jgi:hypothetical protein
MQVTGENYDIKAPRRKMMPAQSPAADGRQYRPGNPDDQVGVSSPTRKRCASMQLPPPNTRSAAIAAGQPKVLELRAARPVLAKSG